MNNQIFTLLILVIAASLGGWLLLKNEDVVVSQIGILFEGILSLGSDIDQVTLTNSSGEIMTAVRMAKDEVENTFPIQESEVEMQQWHIANAANSGKGFAADQDKLSALVSALVNTKLVESKTKQESKYDRLGLESLDKADSQAVEAMLHVGARRWKVLIGRVATTASGTYLRRPNELQTWLSDQRFDIDESQDAWLRHSLFRFSADNIRSIKRTDQEQWEMEKTENRERGFQLVDRQDSSLRYDTILDTFANSIAELSFDSLNAMEDLLWNKLQPVVSLEVETFSGDRYTLALAEGEGNQVLKVSSNVDEAFWSSWLFEVSPYTQTQLNKSHADFLVNEVEVGDDNAIGDAG